MNARYRSLLWRLGLAPAAPFPLIDGGNDFALLEVDGNQAIVIFHVEDGREERPMAWARERIASMNARAELVLLAVGGRADVVQPAFTEMFTADPGQGYAHLVHVPAAGDTWTHGNARLPKALAAALQEPDAPVLDYDVPTVVQATRARARDRFAALGNWSKALQARPIGGSWGLAIGIVLCGLLTVLWGGFNGPTLARAGGHLPRYGLQHPWTYFSYAMLHGGLIHLGMNLYVLKAIGPFIERLIGTARYLVLWILSGVGGAVAVQIVYAVQFALHERGTLEDFEPTQLVIGASGALWGLMVAAGALALRPGEVLPPTVARNLAKATRSVLILNLAISFVPQVSMAGHVGGGIVGAALGFSGLLTLGLPKVGDGAPARSALPRSPVWTALAGLCVTALVLSMALAWVTGQPWVELP